VRNVLLSDTPSEVGHKNPDFFPDGRLLAVSSDDEHNGKYFIRM